MQLCTVVIPTIVPECFSILRYFDTHPSSYWTSSTLMSTLPTIHLLFNNWTFALQVTKQVTTNITAVHINQPCIDSGLCYFIVITSNLHLGFWYSQVISESWLMKCLCCKQHFHRLVDFFHIAHNISPCIPWCINLWLTLHIMDNDTAIKFFHRNKFHATLKISIRPKPNVGSRVGIPKNRRRRFTAWGNCQVGGLWPTSGARPKYTDTYYDRW